MTDISIKEGLAEKITEIAQLRERRDRNLRDGQWHQRDHETYLLELDSAWPDLLAAPTEQPCAVKETEG